MSHLLSKHQAAVLTLVMPLALIAAAARAQAPATAATDNSAVRAEFVQQIEALEAMPSPALAGSIGEASAALRGYVLYPYLEAQRLRTPLRFGVAADDAAVAALLQRDGDAPWTRELRHDWLVDLAKRRNWQPFLANYLDNRADARLRCERLNALIAAQPPEPGTPSPAAADPLRGAVLDLWTTGAQLPDACVAPFEWARARGWFTPELTEKRARLALQAGNADLADFLLRSLPPESLPALRSWTRLLRTPDRELDAIAAAGPELMRAQEPEAIAAAFSKLGRSNPLNTPPRLDNFIRACGTPCALATPATPAELRREVALGSAWSRLPQTVSAFRAVDDAALDERSHEWRIRAALWAGDWKQANAWLAALPPTLAEQQRWRYWRARGLEKNGDKASARALYEKLAGETGYYPLLAAYRLDRGYMPLPAVSAKDPALQQQLAQKPGMTRVRELWLAGRNEWSSLEWSEQIAALDNAQLVQAARLAQTWGAQVQTVAAASKAQVFNDLELLYPRPFENEVAAASRASGVPSNWIYAVMRQESLYDPRARSRADALGLLQMLIGTARDTARRQQQPLPSAADLFNPEINTRLGALHLRELLERYDNEFVLVLGAYNAGPKPVSRWQPAKDSLDADIWIENVPYNETRSYIQRVIWHSAVFGWRADGAPQKIDKLMHAITPTASGDLP
ncbi:transglycosylase SLT domain-containing protein [Hydrocarboniphaga sp.]|uniref:transglycosylase SLT domain-containing protein n=1 Tax=Hydrocarboniphaga sp. TaxID=2033016 RepID=UPI003D10F349